MLLINLTKCYYNLATSGLDRGFDLTEVKLKDSNRKTLCVKSFVLWCRNFRTIESNAGRFLFGGEMDQRTFNTEGWLTPNSYSNNFASLPKRPGIYVLVRATWYPTISHRVLYVGMSTNIAKRLDGHEIKAMCDKEDGKNDYVQVYFKTCPPEALRARERRLIKRFNPPFNLQHRVRGI
jgi:hypothetical protein